MKHDKEFLSKKQILKTYKISEKDYDLMLKTYIGYIPKSMLTIEKTQVKIHEDVLSVLFRNTENINSQSKEYTEIDNDELKEYYGAKRFCGKVKGSKSVSEESMTKFILTLTEFKDVTFFYVKPTTEKNIKTISFIVTDPHHCLVISDLKSQLNELFDEVHLSVCGEIVLPF